MPVKQARIINDITAVLLFAIATILTGMLFTYSGHDSSWFRISDATSIHNAFGVVGANICFNLA